MKYVAYDYEESAMPPHWHVYTTDRDSGPLGDSGSLLIIVAPKTDALHEAVKKICMAIDEAVTLADCYHAR